MGNSRRSASWRKEWQTSSQKIRSYPSSAIGLRAMDSILQPYDPSYRQPRKLDPKSFHPSSSLPPHKIARQGASSSYKMPILRNANSLRTNLITKQTDRGSWLGESPHSKELRGAAWTSRNAPNNSNTRLKERSSKPQHTIHHPRPRCLVMSSFCSVSSLDRRHTLQYPDSSRRRWCVYYGT